MNAKSKSRRGIERGKMFLSSLIDVNALIYHEGSTPPGALYRKYIPHWGKL